jgi:hypothetical protein
MRSHSRSSRHSSFFLSLPLFLAAAAAVHSSDGFSLHKSGGNRVELLMLQNNPFPVQPQLLLFPCATDLLHENMQRTFTAPNFTRAKTLFFSRPLNFPWNLAYSKLASRLWMCEMNENTRILPQHFYNWPIISKSRLLPVCVVFEALGFFRLFYRLGFRRKQARKPNLNSLSLWTYLLRPFRLATFEAALVTTLFRRQQKRVCCR